tara:strand:+ start:412 stop:594 length:183 start_codon:yes stop_codon:yes gene_type:complete
MMYPSKYTLTDELDILIQARIQNFIDGLALKAKPKKETIDQAKIHEIGKFYKNYKEVFDQ